MVSPGTILTQRTRLYPLESYDDEIMGALPEMGLTVNVEHVTDIRQIVQYRVMDSPVPVIGVKVVSVGQISRRGNIKKSRLRKPGQKGIRIKAYSLRNIESRQTALGPLAKQARC